MTAAARATIVLSLTLALASCTGGGAHWFTSGGLPGEWCDEGPATPATGVTTDVSLVVGYGVSSEDVTLITGLLATYFSEYGIRFRVAGGPVPIALERLISAGEVDLERALGGLEPDSPEGRRAIGAALYGDLAEVLATPGDTSLRIVLLREINAGSVSAASIGEAAGLGISPESVRSLADPLLTAVLGDDFTPTAILATDSLAKVPELEAMITSAHEVGHAAGLVHVSGADDLMSPRPAACLPALTASQLSAISRLDGEPES